MYFSLNTKRKKKDFPQAQKQWPKKWSKGIFTQLHTPYHPSCRSLLVGQQYQYPFLQHRILTLGFQGAREGLVVQCLPWHRRIQYPWIPSHPEGLQSLTVPSKQTKPTPLKPPCMTQKLWGLEWLGYMLYNDLGRGTGTFLQDTRLLNKEPACTRWPSECFWSAVDMKIC